LDSLPVYSPFLFEYLAGMRLLLLFFYALSHTLIAKEATLKAPNLSAEPINQRRAYGNGCGPASLLNAFQYGSKKWQTVFRAVPGTNSRSRIRYVVSAWGNKPSSHLKGTRRWKPKEGVNLLDLTDMANEMRSSHFLPKIKYRVLSQKSGESRRQLLSRCHKRITQSLKKGLPPILSLRRYAYRYNQQVGQKSWWPIRADFVGVIELPRTLPAQATSFNIRYVDPYGGFVREGAISTPTGDFTHTPFLEAILPTSSVGNSFVKHGESTLLTTTAIIGTW
jgi:hypothetical protein